jgi:hypothetical protein
MREGSQLGQMHQNFMFFAIKSIDFKYLSDLFAPDLDPV